MARHNILGCRGILFAGFAVLTASTALIPFGSPLAAAGVSPRQSATTAFTATAMDNPWGAGLATAPDPGGPGGGTVPFDVTVPAGTRSITVSDVTGSVSYQPGESNGPDGAPYIETVNISAYGGISGLKDGVRFFYLVGVFLDGSQPATPPATLDFKGDHSFKSLSPLLGQVFFVGNGLTHAGRTQVFHVPSGATDLYLGFTDATDANGPCGGYYNNSGSVTGDVNFKS
jgi:hypothetical protein